MAMRAVLGVLLLANLVAAVIAFKPFGGSADDLRRERSALQQQLAQLQKQVAEKQETGGEGGDRAQPRAISSWPSTSPTGGW